MKKKLILLLFVVVAVFGCSKTKVNTVTNTVDTTVTTIDTPFETPFKSIFTKGIVVDSLSVVSVGSIEAGTEFFTSANGTISKLGCIAPAKNEPYQVSLWDFSTQEILATVTITPTDSLHFFYTAITPVSITANTNYMISVNTAGNGTSLPFYLLEHTNDPNLPFPFSNGSVNFVDSWGQLSASVATFPSDFPGQDFLAPVDFVFKAN
jgi:hypothetical protein